MPRNIFILFSFLVLNFSLQAQNLVFNPSFEVHSGCPVNRDSQHGKYVSGWSGVGQYYHSCGDRFTTPVNIDGYQKPKDGDAYISIVTYDDYDTTFMQPTQRSYSATKLQKPLIAGNLYRLKMQVSAIDNQGSGHPSSVEVFYSNKIGMRLFTQFNMGQQYLKPDNFSHVYSENIITDTASWTEVSGTIRADSNYEYLVIANFFDNAHTQIIRPGSGNHIFLAWYYIDDVEVREIPAVSISDTIICEGTSIDVTTRYAGNFYWHYAGQPSDTLSKASHFTIAPKSSASLVFHSIEDDFTDTFHISVFPPPAINFPDDTLLCEEPLLLLDAFNPGANYTWSTGDTTATIVIHKSGRYWVRATTGACKAEDSIVVQVCEPEVFIPTAFSPDGNDLNDVFLPVTKRVSSYQMQIYNRGGQLIFDGTQETGGWKGSNAPEGAYLCIFRAQAMDGKVIWRKSWVQLVR